MCHPLIWQLISMLLSLDILLSISKSGCTVKMRRQCCGPSASPIGDRSLDPAVPRVDFVLEIPRAGVQNELR